MDCELTATVPKLATKRHENSQLMLPVLVSAPTRRSIVHLLTLGYSSQLPTCNKMNTLTTPLITCTISDFH
jgi:hypothetical protein